MLLLWVGKYFKSISSYGLSKNETYWFSYFFIGFMCLSKSMANYDEEQFNHNHIIADDSYDFMSKTNLQ